MQDSTVTPPGQLNPGTTLYEGRYRIDVVLSHEATRAVYRGWDLKNDHAVTLLELVTHDLDRLQDALQKAHPLVEMQHPAISTIQSAFIERDHFYLGFTIPGGQTIATIMADRKEPIAPASAIRWITHALDTLIFLSHEQKNWHLGDLSPSSLLITSEDRVQVLGFEIPLGLIAPWEMAITLPNGAVAPEMFEDECSAQADVYSISATLYFLLTHDHWENSNDEPLATQRPDLPLTLVETIERGLADDPADRWDDAATFHAALLASLPTERTTNTTVEGWSPPVVSLADLQDDPPTVTIHSDQLLSMDTGEYEAITSETHVQELSDPEIIKHQPLEAEEPSPLSQPLPQFSKIHLLATAPALDTHEIIESSGAIALALEHGGLPINTEPSLPATEQAEAPSTEELPIGAEEIIAGAGIFGIGAGALAAFATHHADDAHENAISEPIPEPDAELNQAPKDEPDTASTSAEEITTDHIAEDEAPTVLPVEQAKEPPWIVGHYVPADPTEEATEEIQQSIAASEKKIIPMPMKNANRSREGVLGKLLSLLRTPAFPSLSTGTIVLPRYYYPQRSSSFLVRIQCRLTSEQHIADHVILTVEAPQESFYFPTTRLALPVPLDGAVSEGTLVCTPLRPTPAGEIDTIRFRFATSDGQEVHRGRAYLAEVVILPPNSNIDDTSMVTLIHNLDVSMNGER